MADKYITVTCTTEGCGTEFRTAADGGHEECPACRSAWYYWRKRRPAQILHRRSRLSVYINRLDNWFTKEGRKS